MSETKRSPYTGRMASGNPGKERMMLKVKRVYEAREDDDGLRVLVDRLWPRGLRRHEAAIDEWAKEIAPSDGLRRWYAYQPERWLEFREKYLAELSLPDKVSIVARIVRLASHGNVTLLYGARDGQRNNARVLAELITRQLSASE